MMTVEEWIDDEKRRLDRFAAFWKRGRQEKPDDFPDLIDDGEWDEQYRCFCDE